MRAKRLLGLFLATCAVVGVLALPAMAAVKLPIKTAADKSFIFAKHTCAHDHNCVKYGVTNCRRISLHVVFCRIFDERSTPAQGRYPCQKLVRVALDPITYRVLVTGQGAWQCR
jgi:hypothetical protein